jgi:GNAT superfamily N-acetyltransferase
MSNSLLGMRLLAPADWQALRTTRLQALTDAPHAFTSSYQLEQGWSEAQWRQLFDTATWILAIEDGAYIGIGSVTGPARSAARHLESLWVAPTHRRSGVLRSLLSVAADSQRRRGVNNLLLWVLEDNICAQMAYLRLGFRATGERQPIARGSSRYEKRMRLAI